MADFELLYKYLPEIAENETRSITLQVSEPGLPADTYTFMESFCTDTDCDCHRAFIFVQSAQQEKVVATLGYGWETQAFYREWFGRDDPSLEGFSGVSLPPGTIQGPLSPGLVDLFKALLQHDEDYRLRILRHYAQFKEAIKVAFKDETPDQRKLKTCLNALEAIGVHPTMEWFEPRPGGCSSVSEVLALRAAHVSERDRGVACSAMRQLWEFWMPEHPSLETRYLRAVAHLKEAMSTASRARMEEAWSGWLEDGVSLLVDEKGCLREEIVETLDAHTDKGVLETLLTSAIHMLTPPAFEPAMDRLLRIDFSRQRNARRFEVLQGMALVNRGDIPGALKLFDRLARQEPRSLAVHLGAGCALLAMAGTDARLLRQAEWYLTRAEQRMMDTDSLGFVLTAASLENLATLKGKSRQITRS